MIWVPVALLAIGVLGFLAWPLFRARVSEESVEEQDYLAAQLQDVERDRDAGVLSVDDAAIADLEARRRILSAARTKRRADGAASPVAKQAVVLLVGAIPAGAIALYLVIGDPGIQRGPADAPVAATSVEEGAPPLTESIARLEQRLKAAPDDVDGWTTLAESYASLDRFPESATAFARAAELAPDQAHLQAALGEALTMANGGVVSAEASAAIEKALGIDSDEPRARFYKAIGSYQQGDGEAALAGLVSLANDAPDGAGWRDIVDQEMAGIASELSRDLASIGLGPRALARQSGAASAAPGDVSSLEADIARADAPYTTWIALAEAYAKAGDVAGAEDAFTRAEARWANAPFVMQEIQTARSRLTSGDDRAPRGPSPEDIARAQSLSEDERQDFIAGMVEGLAARLKSEPDDLEGWMMLGRSYAVLGRPDEGVAAFARAVALAPDNLNARLGYAQALLARHDARSEPISAETKGALEQIVALDAKQTFALFFLGVAAEQAGEPLGAREHWEKLLDLLPPDSADAARVRDMIGAL